MVLAVKKIDNELINMYTKLHDLKKKNCPLACSNPPSPMRATYLTIIIST